MDEGYIKFRPIWNRSAAFQEAIVSALIYWRQACYSRNWIGQYDNGIGFGNISARSSGRPCFYITGSATGGVPQLTPQGVTKVTKVIVAENRLWCTGPIVASSESMSHAAIYEELCWVEGVIHIHDAVFWKAALHQLPTTTADAAYGTPEMVSAIKHLLRTTALPQQRVFVMEGHEDGIFAFGENLAQAFEALTMTFNELV